MRLLLEIGHPAHVHFFLRSIRRLQQEGDQVFVVTRGKEITNQLLDSFQVPYTCLSYPAEGAVGMATELMGRWRNILGIIKDKSIDTVASISGISTSLPSKLRNTWNVVFTDTEDAYLSNRIAFPFASRILTPKFFLGDLGPKHQKYFGLHELSYLQKLDEKELTQTRKNLNLPEHYSVIRLIGNEALHDRGLKGITRGELAALIKALEPLGQVFIYSSLPLPAEFAHLRLQTAIDKIHAVLGGARVFVGESPTMAVESSLLGTPALLVSGRVGQLGNMIGLEREYSLLLNFKTWAEAAAKVPGAESIDEVRGHWGERASAFRISTVDMNELILSTLKGGRH